MALRVIAFVFASWLGTASLRETALAAHRSRIVFDGWLPDFSRTHLEVPALHLMPKSCVIPDWQPVADRGPRPALEPWCLGSEDQRRRLLGLIEHMRAERKRLAAAAITAWDVGVPLNVVLLGDVPMLNPELVNHAEPETCVLRDDAGRLFKKPGFRLVDVRYTSLMGLTETRQLADVEACIAQQF